MALVIDLPEDTEAYFAALPAEAQNQIAHQFNIYITAVLNQKKADAEGMNGIDPEDAKWWRSLSPEQQEVERNFLVRGLADIDAGRTHPAEEVYARLRAKYGKPSS